MRIKKDIEATTRSIQIITGHPSARGLARLLKDCTNES